MVNKAAGARTLAAGAAKKEIVKVLYNMSGVTSMFTAGNALPDLL